MSANQVNSNHTKELEALRARVAELESAETQRCREEIILRESEQLYRNLVDTSLDCIVLTDLKGRVLMANRQAAEMHGYTRPEEMLGTDVLELVAPEDRASVTDEIRHIIEQGSVRDRRYTLLGCDGASFKGEFSGSLIRDPQGAPKYILCNGRDITVREQMQREFIESQKIESIGRLAGGIAHDFNNLLAVVLGNASLLMRNKTLPAKTRECLGEIVEAAERASSLTTQLLAYARGGLRRAVPAEANTLIKSTWEILRRTTPPQIDLALNLAERLPKIVVDQAQLLQVIINLCVNAVQASPIPSRIEITTGQESMPSERGRELGLPPGEYVTIRIKDHGGGMSPDVLERAFEPFYTTKPDSRGMGLPAALGIVQGHGGQLQVDSREGEGTQATIWLPVESREDAENTISPSTWSNPLKGNETVLVVDDDPRVSRTAEQILASLGYFVVTRTDGDEALAFLDTNGDDLDLVILNLNMPKRTADQMLDMVLSKCPGMKVLLMSGLASQDGLKPLLDRGATAFLQKPFSIWSLAEAVRKTLDAKVS